MSIIVQHCTLVNTKHLYNIYTMLDFYVEDDGPTLGSVNVDWAALSMLTQTTWYCDRLHYTNG